MARLPQPWVRKEELKGDASTRSYCRLWNDCGGTAVLVQYPEIDRLRLARDLEVGDWCRRQGLRVPAVIDHDVANGWAVLEDFGERDAEHDITSALVGQRLALGMRAIAPLVAFSKMVPGDLPGWNAPLDRHRLRWELAGLELWYLAHRCGVDPSPKIGAWLDWLASTIAEHPKRVCHRDYHLNNIFFVDDGEVGLIDFQDLLVGPDTYDAVSLLGERAMPLVLDEKQRELIRRAWAESSGAAAGWRDRWRLVGIQRGLKVLGTFSRLAASGAQGYEGWLATLARDLSPELEAVAAPEELVEIVKP